MEGQRVVMDVMQEGAAAIYAMAAHDDEAMMEIILELNRRGVTVGQVAMGFAAAADFMLSRAYHSDEVARN